MGTFSKELQMYVSPKFNEQVFMQALQEHFNMGEIKIEKITYDLNRKKGDSYLSTVFQFVVKGRGENKSIGCVEKFELPLIAKSLPSNIARRITFRSTDFFRNEVAFYNIVWKAMREFQLSKKPQPVFDDIPLCVSCFADGSHDFVVLENLAGKEYFTVPRSNGLDINHVRLIMQTFAKFHAVALAFKDQQPDKFQEIAASLEETYFAEKFRSWYEPFQVKSLYAVVRDAVEKQLSEPYLKKVDEFFKNDLFGTLIRHCQGDGRFSVITHGDAWVPNFLIKCGRGNKTPQAAMMIDFQLARYASFANDITFFLYSCTEQSLRSTYWDSLIEEYHKNFTQVLVELGSSGDLLTLEDVKNEIKEHAFLGIGMSMEAVVMSLLEDEETADLDMIQGENGATLESVWIIHPFKEEARRQRLADIIKEAVDHEYI